MPELELKATKTRNRGRLVIFATFVVLLLCCVPSVWNYYRVAGVQDALNRDYEISFGKREEPTGIEKLFYDKLEEWLRSKEGKWGRMNPDIIYGERIRAMFRGSITEIHIYYHEGFRGDLGSALLRFPELKKVTVWETDPNNADYKLLCTRLRELPALEELELGDERLMSDSLTPLEGHPKLRKVVIRHSCNLSTNVLQTFKKLPALQVVEVDDIYGLDVEEWKSPALHTRFRKELPGVTLTLPQP
jgi:hypothetical protein